MLTTLFPATQWSLIQRLEHTQSPADALIERYVPAIRAYLALKFPSLRSDRIDDLCQDVLMRLLEQPELLARACDSGAPRFRHYLMRVAWNLARNAYRQQRQRLRDQDLDPELLAQSIADDTVEEADVREQAWALALLQAAMQDLEHWQASGRIAADIVPILRANLVQGASVRSIAQDLGLSTATCGRRLIEGRQLIIRALCDRLRAAGELSADADPEEAYQLLQRALR